MRRFGRTLVTAVLTVAVITGTAGWASADTQQAVTGPVPGTAAWLAEPGLRAGGGAGTGPGAVRGLPDPGRAAPREVARFFAALDPDEAQALVRRHPLVVGNLDGVPVALRYQANRIAILASGEARYLSLAGAGRQILAFDPRGRGQVAEVFGDLARAEHVAVIVPGSDNDASTHDRTRKPYSGPGGMAQALRASTGDATAVVAWTGYTTPVGVGLDAAQGRLAEAGAARLTRFLAGLDAVGAADPALFCHSYGSVVCGLAARNTDARDIVVLGSPGMRADNVAALHTRARVWAAKSPSDWIDDIPNVEFAGLGHGADPTSSAFGARRVPAADAEGHAGYFVPGTQSLAAFAAIATGAAR
ncbi:alpha/beta hydrolase family protein [Streptomyces sp. NBC_00536]|uniref:alpha/beta hydrolase n=1 Tax=Streptomyces sp. NBC_00536 TaxID=2975769 RepID=UPI002E815BB8|nr:alpha/beta hydrolase [Streptomyces sp. NBC_00536]WUC82675.1 alpha/beta hydrolase family protein [Streptomyces sp. NBC_00536]